MGPCQIACRKPVAHASPSVATGFAAGDETWGPRIACSTLCIDDRFAACRMGDAVGRCLSHSAIGAVRASTTDPAARPDALGVAQMDTYRTGFPTIWCCSGTYRRSLVSWLDPARWRTTQHAMAGKTVITSHKQNHGNEAMVLLVTSAFNKREEVRI